MSEAATARQMLRMKEVARLIGVDRATIARWVAAEQFPSPVNVGEQASRFYEDEIAAWQKLREEQSTAPPRSTKPKPLKPRVGFRRPPAA